MAAIFLFLLLVCVMGIFAAEPSALDRQKRDAQSQCSKDLHIKAGDPPLYLNATAECGSGPDGNYPNNADWSFWVALTGGSYVNIQYDIDVQTGPYCPHDRITFSMDHAPVMCGKQRGQFSFHGTSSLFYVMFNSDEDITARGFAFNITVSSRPEYSTEELPRFMDGNSDFYDSGATTATPTVWSPDFYATNTYNNHFYTRAVRTAARLASLRTELRELTDAVREVVLTFDDFEAAYNNDNPPQYVEQPLRHTFMK